MLTITQGLQRNSLSSMDRFAFDDYDKNGDGVISYSEYANFIAVTGANKTEKGRFEKQKRDKGFNVEQFDPQGSINFESNGGFNTKKLNIIA